MNEPALEVAAPSQPAGRLVLKNTVFLMVAQVAGMPLSILLNVVLARRLGTNDFGHMYVATWVVLLTFTLVEWGHSGALPALVAQGRQKAAVYLGSSIAFRLATAVIGSLALVVVCSVLKYAREVQISIVILFANALVGTIATACQDTIRGFERTDTAATAYVGQQVLNVLLVIPTALLGGGLYGVLVAQLATSVLLLVYALRCLRLVGIERLVTDREVIRRLTQDGFPFMAFGISMVLQPTVDASFLSRLAPEKVVGWHGGARRLVGVLVFPASALIGSLYPTLCRLRVESEDAFKKMTRSALRSAMVLVFPAALSCALFPDIGTTILGRAQYAPADQNLQVLSIFLALVYLTMPLGTAILAWGKRHAWNIAQLICVAVALLFDAPLIRWFQARTGNGGLGVCASNVIAEAFVIAAGVILVPRGTFDRSFMRQVALTCVAAGAMVVPKVLLAPRVSSFAIAPLSITAYFVCLWAIGGLKADQLRELFSLMERVRQKLGRFLRSRA